VRIFTTEKTEVYASAGASSIKAENGYTTVPGSITSTSHGKRPRLKDGIDWPPPEIFLFWFLCGLFGYALGWIVLSPLIGAK
jgi:hypothetical protein